jgi:four helix bundle protein
MTGEIRSYRDLRVWNEAMTLAESCYRFSQECPREELFGLTSQIRRAATSIPANVAEGYGRDSKGSYVKFLKTAQGSLKELETHLILAQRLKLGPTPPRICCRIANRSDECCAALSATSKKRPRPDMRDEFYSPRRADCRLPIADCRSERHP